MKQNKNQYECNLHNFFPRKYKLSAFSWVQERKKDIYLSQFLFVVVVALFSALLHHEIKLKKCICDRAIFTQSLDAGLMSTEWNFLWLIFKRISYHKLRIRGEGTAYKLTKSPVMMFLTKVREKFYNILLLRHF